MMSWRLGEWKQAPENYSHSLRLLEQIGDVDGIAIAHNNRGLLFADQGNVAAQRRQGRVVFLGKAAERVDLLHISALERLFDAFQAKVIGALAFVEGHLNVIAFVDQARDKHVFQRVHPA